MFKSNVWLSNFYGLKVWIKVFLKKKVENL